MDDIVLIGGGNAVGDVKIAVTVEGGGTGIKSGPISSVTISSIDDILAVLRSKGGNLFGGRDDETEVDSFPLSFPCFSCRFSKFDKLVSATPLLLPSSRSTVGATLFLLFVLSALSELIMDR